MAHVAKRRHGAREEHRPEQLEGIVVGVGELRDLDVDEETMAAATLMLASQGNVRTTTMRALSADEMRAVIAKTG